MLYSSFAWMCADHQGPVDGFQPSSPLLPPRTITRSWSQHLQASKVSDITDTERVQESRTWNVQRRKTENKQNYNKNNSNSIHNKVGPILPDGSPIHTSENGVLPGLERKKMKPMPVTGYDAQSILDFYDRRPLQVGWRLNSLGFPLLGWYLGLLTDKAIGIADKSSVQRKRGEELRNVLVKSKSVALVKVS